VRNKGNLAKRHAKAKAFKLFCAVVTWSGVAILAILLYHVGEEGARWVDWQFLTSFPSRHVEQAGIKSALYGTLWLVSMVAFFSIPIGVSAAIYLEEYVRKGKLSSFIEVNIANLAGVPSIVYGMLGLVVFVRYLNFDRSLLSGSLTMSLLILPVIIIASREAIKSVPSSIRHAAYALGATKWQTVRSHVIPEAISGILTGVILALSRAIGETAPIIMVGALSYVAFVPEGPMDSFAALPIQVFNWVSRPQKEFHQLSAATIIVLLVVLLLMNATAVYIRQRAERKHQH